MAGADFVEELEEVDNPISAPGATFFGGLQSPAPVPMGVVVQVPSTLEVADGADGGDTLAVKSSVRICGRACSYSSLSSLSFLVLLLVAVLVGAAINNSGVGSTTSSNIDHPTIQAGAAPPPTDGVISCDGPTQTVVGTTIGALNNVGNDSGDRLYSFQVAPGGHLVRFDSCGSNFDTFLHSFDRAMSVSLASCGECGPCGKQTVLDVEILCSASSAQYNPSSEQCEYVLAIEGFFAGNIDSEGQFTITMTCEDTELGNEGTITCGEHVAGSTVGTTNSIGKCTATSMLLSTLAACI